MIIITFFEIPITQTQIPGSIRSKIAIQRNKDTLESEFERHDLTFGNNIFIRIFKESNELEVWIEKTDTFKLFKTYKICYYSGGLGTKTIRGDCKSPDGFYFVTPKQLNPNSTFHLSFNIGYPNKYDRSHGYTGGSIMVHGDCVSIECYAMTDEQIEKIWTIIVKAFENGQSFFRIHISPFRISDKNLEKHRDSEWFSLWLNLKEGYEYFEINKRPPNVTVRNNRYYFN